MTEGMVEPVVLERLRRDAVCVIARLGLGEYELRGPAENILVVESYVAWSTVQSELANEGYGLVDPQTCAEACGLPTAEILAQLHDRGSRFALLYDEFVAIALPEKAAVLPEIEV